MKVMMNRMTIVHTLKPNWIKLANEWVESKFSISKMKCEVCGKKEWTISASIFVSNVDGGSLEGAYADVLCNNCFMGKRIVTTQNRLQLN